MARKRTKGVQESGEDQLLAEISTDMENAGMLESKLDDEYIVADLNDYVSSGSSLLDLAVSNRPNAGIITFGRILELNGLEGSGKSLICAHMIKDVQQDDGVAVWFDTEYAVDQQNVDFFKAVGVDFNKLRVFHNICLEDVFLAIEQLITNIRKKNKDRKVLIIIDSLTALKPRSELEGKMEKDGYGTQKAKFLSDALSRINSLIAEQKIALVFTQQLRQKMNAMAFADPYTTSGGRAPRFYASVRIRLTQKGQIKVKVKEETFVVGTTVKAKVIKNRLGPPYRTVELDIYFDRGIDDVSSWLAVLKKRDIISGSKGHFTYIDNNGVEHKFRTGTWKEFCDNNPTIFEEIYSKLAESMIMAYNTDGISRLDGTAEIDTEPVEE